MADEEKGNTSHAAQGNTDPASSDPKDGNVNEDPKVEDPKVEDPKVEDPKVEDPKVEDPKVEDPKPKGDVPEEYGAFSVSDGFVFDDEVKKDFNELAKGVKLTQENAQKFIDVANKSFDKFVKAQTDAQEEIKEEWVKEIKEDRDFGGAKLNNTLAGSKKVVSKFGSMAFAKFLADTGLGDNPELIKTFARIYDTIGEDKFVEGKIKTPLEQKTPGSVLYDGKKSN